MNLSFIKVVALALPIATTAFLNAEQQKTIPVDGIELQIQTDLTLPDKKVPLEIIDQTTFSLSVLEDGVIVPLGAENATVQEFGIADAPQGDYSLDALNSLQSQIVQSLSSEGYFGIAVVVDPDQMDFQTGEDFRDETTLLNLQIWLGEVVEQRTISKGSRIKEGEDSVNHHFQRDVIKNSPFAVASEFEDEGEDESEGFLIDKPALENYLERLNQHPRRRADVALSSSGEPGKIVLDYIVSEAKPWLVYFQVSNTGTEATGEWRERIGGIHYQLTGNDDILTVDYLTAEFDRANAFVASYEVPIVKPDYISAEIYFSYSDFAAQNIQTTAPDAEGETVTHGLEFKFTPFYYKEHSISFTAGLKQEDITIENVFGSEGLAKLSSPYLRLEAFKNKQVHRSLFSISLEKNLTENDEQDLQGTGRQSPTNDYEFGSFELLQSFFLEPLLPSYRQANPEKWRANALVNEFAFLFRGQYAFSDARLIPQKQISAGGFFSVRGYEESIARGDSGFFGSLEYRVHLARLLKPASLLDKIDPKDQAPDVKTRNRFNYRAPGLYGLPDWNFLMRFFFDYASLSVNPLATGNLAPGEVEQDMASYGIGFEFQYRSNLNIRLDYGIITKDLGSAIPGEPVENGESGDSRLHVLATLSF